MVSNKIKIGIIGLGYVGGAVQHWFKSQKNKYELFLYDKYKNIGSLEIVNQADIIFVAVPTPYKKKGGYDDSAVRESLKNIKNDKVVVIKSTILPGSTDKFQKTYPQKTVLFNPEFLRAKTAKKDFITPDRQIVGYVTPKSKGIASRILKILPKALYKKVVKAKEAEMIKYFSNTYLATRVVFANQIYDFCQKLGGIDYSVIKDCLVCDPRIGNSHFDIFHEGHRGYSGGCFPKDVKAFLDLARQLGVRVDLIKEADSINDKLLKQKKAKWH